MNSIFKDAFAPESDPFENEASAKARLLQLIGLEYGCVFDAPSKETGQERYERLAILDRVRSEIVSLLEVMKAFRIEREISDAYHRSQSKPPHKKI